MGASLLPSPPFLVALLFAMSCLCFFPEIRLQNVTRLYHTKSAITVNGKFPRPRIVAREGDRLLIKDTSILGAESHPLHLHGYNFFIVGQGFGNNDPNKDPANFNLVDPVERNTVAVPSGGWLAIRFCADNPGLQNVTRLCHTKSAITVNGKFPGPRIVAREGDRLLIKVVNHVQHNITIHWHGIRQLRSGWYDGPAYIAQCPIQTGQTYVYNFTIVGQRGTLWWHAHISWLRATLYGPIIILPQRKASYPFPKPYKEVPIIFGEWWNAELEAVINQSLQTGGGPNVSDAYTINGLPGPLYNCSTNDTFKLKVKPGKTYLLRLINAALNDDLFFSIANHTLITVDADAIYVKPFKSNIILITPGQTSNVLLKTKNRSPNATFLMAARPYSTGLGTFDNSTSAGILEYEQPANSSSSTKIKNLPLLKPTLPSINDTSFAANFSKTFCSLANAQFPAIVPQRVQKRFFFTIGLGSSPCPKNKTCQGPSNVTKFAAFVNNISFTLPTTALLQAHFFGQSKRVYTTDFPKTPLFPFNYTGTPPNNTLVSNGTKVVVLPFNTSVELVIQDTSILGAESHPLHLHGYNFFIVGQGFGNYDPNKDPANFNLVDPVERNTVAVPSGGWVAIRFLADNPGVWFMHCHYDVHLSWGLGMALVVMDGKLPNQKLPPPPSDLPQLHEIRIFTCIFIFFSKKKFISTFIFFMQIRLQNVTRLCHTKSAITVNGKFPGPRIFAREGDRLLIEVVNHVQHNITIHWLVEMLVTFFKCLGTFQENHQKKD
ncbi:hypothetical protein L1049_007843 [Liquidambar formosana]|uniref:Laccase n=1 Tax=Liquidambar formosana TaxID=63359 RepID=A0AAP0S8S2_LIQFO